MSFISKVRCALTLGQGLLIESETLKTSNDPISFFEKWLAEAENAGIILPESMSLATCTAQGRPSSRIVLLKEVNQKGFVFFTNYGSHKAAELEANPYAALLFHWNMLQRQVRIEGRIERISTEESNAYFKPGDVAAVSAPGHPIKVKSSLIVKHYYNVLNILKKNLPAKKCRFLNFGGGIA